MKRNSSLRRKLTALIAGGGIMSALIAAAGFSWLDVHRFWQNTNSQVVAIASIVADQVEPAIALGDRKAAAEILNSLRADRMIRDAVLYDPRGACFARMNSPSAACPALPPDGLHHRRDTVVLASPIQADGERQGTLVLSVSVPSMWEVLRQYQGGAALIIMLSLVVAAVLAMVLQSRVSAPILAIAQVAERISKTHRFQDRVAVTSGDELGVLAQSFNSMLDEIVRRDAKLEQEIVERQQVNVELRSAKEHAEEAVRLKSEFLANMSHEIRTPMNGVVGMISLVLDRAQDPEDREQLLVAQNAAQSLIIILNDILDLSKMEAGKMTIDAIACNLPTLVQDCLRMFEFAVREKKLDLRLDVSPGCPVWVRADPVRVRQILVNVIGNAIKFTAAGSVTVTLAAHAGNLIRIEVRDTGIGIAASKLHSIFDAFTQADGSHTRQFGGTGLGLTITRRLVQLMGGRLWAESEPGQGSRFLVELALPRTVPPETREQVAPPPVPVLPADGGLRILVAEDNVINQKVICLMLRRQGWSVTLAVNGVEACRHFRENYFDLVLMDVQMPEMDGLEAARRIRADEAERGLARTPILALTAHASQTQHELCLAQGMDSVITKPVNLPSLLREIAAAVAERCQT
ncbi:MAG TPA: ATP-binding protein [Candidatus Solibacter sp.]|nr:ATP-binding protein [Candidatus Solibacter sp.]